MRVWIFAIEVEPSLLRELGFTDVAMGTLDVRVVKAIREMGIKAHFVVAAFRLPRTGEVSELLAVDPNGARHRWFDSGCPNNPELRRACLRAVEQALTVCEYDNVILDGIRFASPGSGLEAFATCFCDKCRCKASEMGFNFERMRLEVKRLLEGFGYWELVLDSLAEIGAFSLPHLALSNFGIVEWLEFKAKCVEEHVESVRDLARSYGAGIGAYVFTPSLAWLVGQCYPRLAELLDFVKPMVYRLGKGVACMNYELHELTRLLAERFGLNAISLLERFYNALHVRGPGTLEELLEKGLPPEITSMEASAARRLIPSGKLHPIIMLRDPHLEDVIRGMLEVGVDGLDFFAYKRELKNLAESGVKAIKSYFTH